MAKVTNLDYDYVFEKIQETWKGMGGNTIYPTQSLSNAGLDAEKADKLIKGVVKQYFDEEPQRRHIGQAFRGQGNLTDCTFDQLVIGLINLLYRMHRIYDCGDKSAE